jgi:hypothetical protein
VLASAAEPAKSLTSRRVAPPRRRGISTANLGLDAGGHTPPRAGRCKGRAPADHWGVGGNAAFSRAVVEDSSRPCIAWFRTWTTACRFPRPTPVSLSQINHRGTRPRSRSSIHIPSGRSAGSGSGSSARP